ncbi:MAG: isoleucine--tRNA ligase, partial [Gammaproteobacteria bacterium RIFCSPHIGHO2_02_FULL_42_13]
IVLKSKTMAGFDAPYVPGWDCHGLPIELNVEKKKGKPGQKISTAEFRQACQVYAAEQVQRQRVAFERLGVLGDWDHPYLTMDYAYEAEIIRSLANMVEGGHVARGFKPVHWCIDCRSALAEAEVEYHDHASPAIDVRFKVVDAKAFLKRFHHLNETIDSPEIFVPIWTTTPWTLPANQAVALNPHLEYMLVKCSVDGQVEYLLVVEALLGAVMQRYGMSDYQMMGRCSGQVLENLLLHHPFYDRTVPLILGQHVTIETGTGAVHTAPGHGQDDYMAGQQYGLLIDNPVGSNGCFLPETLLFAGEHVFKANDHVVEILKEKNALLHKGTIQHSYPCCWRHKTPLIFRATPQWFVKLDKSHLRDVALDEIAKTKWVPHWGQIRIANMVAQRPDWCISRQRTWGVPIPFFIHKETGDLHPNTVPFMLKIADRVEKEGVEAWHQLNIEDLLGDDAEIYEKTTDTLDVWFDSGVSHAAVLSTRSELKFPANLYLEGSDQYRGWFQSSLLTSCAIHEVAPYHTVVTHGFIVDEHGHKMSKSLGNVVSPDMVMKELGADILRLWIASIDYQADVPVSDQILQRTSDVYRRIRNTAKFLLSNLHGFDPKKDLVPEKKLLMLDRWAIDCARQVQEEICTAYEHYDLHVVYQKIHYFCSIDLGSFYLDVIKDRQYTTHANSLARRSTQTAMYHIMEAMVRWMAPILSFTADEIWQYMPGAREESVFLATWYEGLIALSDKETMNRAYWEKVRAVRDVVNKEIERLRGDNVLGSALEAEVTLYVDADLQKILDALEDELRFVLITSRATVEKIKKAPEDASHTTLTGLKLKVSASKHKKCVRCWHRRADVGKHAQHPELCERCVTNVDGKGEERKFA